MKEKIPPFNQVGKERQREEDTGRERKTRRAKTLGRISVLNYNKDRKK